MPVDFDRDARLSDVKADPVGWGSIDLERLLEAWEFKSVHLGVSYGRTSRLWYHESNPTRFNVVVPLADPVGRAIVEQAIDVIEAVSRLGGRL